MAFIADLEKKRKIMGKKNTVPRGNSIPSESLEYLEDRESKHVLFI